MLHLKKIIMETIRDYLKIMLTTYPKKNIITSVNEGHQKQMIRDCSSHVLEKHTFSGGIKLYYPFQVSLNGVFVN